MHLRPFMNSRTGVVTLSLSSWCSFHSIGIFESMLDLLRFLWFVLSFGTFRTSTASFGTIHAIPKGLHYSAWQIFLLFPFLTYKVIPPAIGIIHFDLWSKSLSPSFFCLPKKTKQKKGTFCKAFGAALQSEGLSWIFSRASKILNGKASYAAQKDF